MSQPFVMSLLFVLGLLLVGFVLRAGLKPLRVLFVPASVVGGLVGLCVMQAGLRTGPGEMVRVDGNLGADAAAPTQMWFAEVSNIIDGWPGLLIAVVFAGLLIERPGKTFREAMVRAGREGIVVWINVFGQAFLGLLACVLLIAPFYPEIPRAFGQLLEAGWAGGHGTAAAMGEVYDNRDFPVGRDLAFLFATSGLIYGVISGIFFVNLGVRRGWLRGGRTSAPSDITIPIVSGLENRTNSPPSAFAKVRNEVIDPFAFQLCILAAAFATGYGMQQLFLWLAQIGAPTEWYEYIENIPLFLFTLLGGWVVREIMHFLGFGDLIDAPSIHRLSGIAMELLIVAALSTLRIEAAVEYFWPVILLLGIGCVWTAFCLLWVSRKMLPKDYWFELGLINYGMATATTAQGVLLLRIVDRDLESGAAEDYAAAAPLSAPFVGGGVLTVLAIPFALERFNYWPVLAVMAVIMVALFVAGWMLRDRERS